MTMANHDKWIELCTSIRLIYQNAIPSSTVDDKEKHVENISIQLKNLVDSLWDEDWQQLLIRISVLIRDFVMEACNRLKNIQNVDGLPVLYLKGLLENYDAFCNAAKTFSPYVCQLDDLLQKRFAVNFEFLNKYLFHACFYLDPFLQNNVPLYISQTQSSNQDLIHTYLAFDEEMTDIASRWLDVKKLILKYGKKRATDKKGSMILEVWESYREHREIAANKKWIKRDNIFGKNDVGEFDVQLLSLLDDITNRFKEIDLKAHTKISDKQCKNCNTDILCNCDDCSIKHILTCGLNTPPMSPGDKTSPNHLHSQSQLLQQLSATSKASFLKLMTDKVIRNTLKMDIDRKSKKGVKNDTQNNGKLCTNKNNQNIAPSSKSAVKITEATKKNTSDDQKTKCLLNDKTKIYNNTNTNDNTKNKTPKQNDITTEKNDVLKTGDTVIKKTVTNDKKASRICSCLENKNGNCSNFKKKENDTSENESCNDKQKNTQNSKKCLGSFCKKSALKSFCLEHNDKNHEMLRHCDCSHDEGFEALTHINIKYNRMRDRLRNRLNEKRSNAVKENKISNKTENTAPQPVKVKKEPTPVVEQKKTESVTDTRDIKDLLNFIEGVETTKKEISAKNAAKKQKRLEKKLREKEEKEAEERRIAEELERQKELERQQMLQAAKLKSQAAKSKKDKSNSDNRCNDNNKKNKNTIQLNQNNSSNNNNNNNISNKISSTKTGPMVTIKRIMEGSNKEPTVTITLKGSTPDKDKLLYTLVNGQTDSCKEEEKTPELSNRQKKKLKKLEEQAKKELEALVTGTQSLKISQSSNSKDSVKTNNKQNNKTQQSSNKTNSNKTNSNKNKINEDKAVTVSLHSKTETMLNLQMLKLPPGITITKVEGPTVNRKVNITTKSSPETPAVNNISNNTGISQPTENRSGIIVVDTVKLKEDLPDEKKAVVTNGKKKKNKKKKNKKGDVAETNDTSRKTVHITTVSSKNTNNSTKQNSQILTLKNPMFYQLQEQLDQDKLNKSESTNHFTPSNENIQQTDGTCQQASIIKGANGMVTIRSPRLGNINTSSGRNAPFMSLHSVGAPVLSELKPIVGTNSSTYSPSYTTDNKRPFNAQEILSSLPGIEITKINKNTIQNKNECKKAFQPADVSIIPTNLSNGVNGDTYKLFYDNSDWSLESVFDPKDIKEDEVLDAEELELEAFKRFCQQSVPPERKEKVAYLNVKDIILKKKASSSRFS